MAQENAGKGASDSTVGAVEGSKAERIDDGMVGKGSGISGGLRRTHTCGDLRNTDDGSAVVLNGWVHTRRDHGGVIFIDLRDRYGFTQVVFNPGTDFFSQAEKLRREDVIAVQGLVRPRPDGMINPHLTTGEIEVLAEALVILNKAEVPPLEVDDRVDASEDMRLQYRYLDLRRPKVAGALQLRHRIVSSVRDFFNQGGFLDIETPILCRSTPEGARDYLVPSRVHPGKFYALPQSPQLYKQSLMISGLDRYYQIAKCFRDEDLRADRQPEFTQIDVEMSFVDSDDVLSVMEHLMAKLWKEVLGVDLHLPFPRYTFQDVMETYGTDKPDLRYGLKLVDVTSLVKSCSFQVFSSNDVRMLRVPGGGKFSRNDVDGLIAFAQQQGAKGLAWMKSENGTLTGSITKYFSPEELIALRAAAPADDGQGSVAQGYASPGGAPDAGVSAGVKDGDLLLFMAGPDSRKNCTYLGKVRQRVAEMLGLIPVVTNEKETSWNFSWTTDFPLFEYSEEENRYMAMHHPFTSPMLEDMHLLDEQPGKVRSKAYDLILNGNELGGGSIRIHERAVQQRMFRALGISDAQAQEKFGFLLEALTYGAPPHGGIAFGLDRLCTLMGGYTSIRDVIAFPKTKTAESLMDGSPGAVDDAQLKELHIGLSAEAKAAKAAMQAKK